MTDPTKRYDSIYRAVVKDNKDPKKLRRIKVSITQLTGSETTEWVWPVLSTERPPAIGSGVYVYFVGGDPDYPVWIGEFGDKPQGVFCYGAWYNTQTMNALAINTAYPMQCNSITIENGVKLVDKSKMTVEQSGTYNIQFSAQFDKANANTQHAYVWLKKNGVTVPYSASKLAVQGSTAEFVAAWNFYSEAKAGDYFQVVGSVTDTGVFLPAIAPNGVVPGVPSVILTINQIA